MSQPQQPISQRARLYQQFSAALLAGELDVAEAMIATDVFVAKLPGGPGLPWHLFIMEFARRIAPFSNFGQQVDMLAIVEGGGKLFSHYRMTVTNDRPLTLWKSTKTIQPSNKTFTMECVDIVTFGPDDKIVSIDSITDRLDNLVHMGIPRE